MLYSAAYGVLRSREDAEDCVHEALLHVWRNPRSYSSARGPLGGFLAVCVRNRALTQVRRDARRARIAQSVAAAEPAIFEPEFPDAIESMRLQRAIAALPEEQRTPLLLAFYRDKTHVQIARELGSPLGTVKRRISLAMKKLAAALRAPEVAK